MKRKRLIAVAVLALSLSGFAQVHVYSTMANELIAPFQQQIIPDCFNISPTETVIHTGADSATGQVHQAVCWDLVADVINIPHLWCNGQMSCGGGSVGITGTGIANMIAKFTAPHVIADSSGFDDGTNYVQFPNGVSTENDGLGQTLPNSASPGTVLNQTVCVNSSEQARVCTSTDVSGQVAGIAVQGAGTAGIVRYCITQCPATYDNQTVIGDIAIVSSTTGELHDTGSTTGTQGVDNFIVDAVNTGAGTIAQTDILTPRRVSVAVNASGTKIEINGTSTQPIANFNTSTPAAPGGNTNCTWQSSNSGGTTSASCYVPTGLSGAQYQKVHIQTGLGDGVNAMAAATYPMLFGINDSGVTWTITGISCYTDNAGTSALAATNNAGTALISGTCTCNATKSNGGQACTQSATTTLAAGDAVNFSFTADGTSKTTTWKVTVTQ